MLPIREAKAAILRELYELYKTHTFNGACDLSGLAMRAGVDAGTAERVVLEFHDDGVVECIPVLGGIVSIHLTVNGVQDFEDPDSEIAPLVQLITIHGDVHSSQIGGSGNVLSVTNVSSVLLKLADKIEIDQTIPVEKRTTWADSLRAIVHDGVAGATLAEILKNFLG